MVNSLPSTLALSSFCGELEVRSSGGQQPIKQSSSPVPKPSYCSPHNHLATDCKTSAAWCNSQHGYDLCIFSKFFRPPMGPTQSCLMVTLHPFLADFLHRRTRRIHRSTALCRACGHTAHALRPYCTRSTAEFTSVFNGTSCGSALKWKNNCYC
jgi:hypothetical protein